MELTTFAKNVLNALDTLIGRGAHSSAVRLGLNDARQMERLALEEIEAAKVEHTEAIRTFDRDRGLAALDREQRATFDLGAARDAMARFEAEEAAAIAAEEQARRRKAYDEAAAALAEAEDALVAEYPSLAHRIREIVRIRAEADARVEAINADLPAGVQPLQSLASRYFHWQGLPREVLEVAELDLWVSDRSGHVLADERQKEVQDLGGGKGQRLVGNDAQPFSRRRVRREKFLPAWTGTFYDGFSNVLSLPGLVGEQPYFTPAYDDRPSTIFGHLAELEAREASIRPVTREPQIRDEILPDSEPVAA